MTESQREQWSRMRARGMLSVILRYGILVYGAPLAAVTALQRYFWPVSATQWKGLPIETGLFVVTSVLIAALMGWLLWRSNEKRFHMKDRESGREPRATSTI